jgi:N-acetyl-gamma-glutamyl-phosphate reductase
MAMKRIGIVGARGYAGGEFLRLVVAHGGFELSYAASRALAGKPYSALAPGLGDKAKIVAPDPESAARAGLEACVLAMPNGEAKAYADAFDAHSPDTVILDFSADFRGVAGWAYGLPELGRRDGLRGARRIANPGCYATAVALALAPLVNRLAGSASAFAVSGWSGAGTTPSPRNDAARLVDNVMPYALAGHGHEKEVREALGVKLAFTPHVAGFFRGLVATVHAPLTDVLSRAALAEVFRTAYGDEPLIELADDPPEAKDGANIMGAIVGGFTAVPGESRVVVCCALDNLLKGAASQALQNLNLALGFEETRGLVE